MGVVGAVEKAVQKTAPQADRRDYAERADAVLT